MRSSTAIPARQNFDPALRGVCEKSARSVMSVLRRSAPAGTSPEILMDLQARLKRLKEIQIRLWIMRIVQPRICLFQHHLEPQKDLSQIYFRRIHQLRRGLRS